MYNMLQEELQWAVDDKEPYDFTHYLIVSKTYTEVASKLDQEDSRPQKRKKAQAASTSTFYFHPEDEVLHQHAVAHGSYDYTKQGDEGAADSKRAFHETGIRPQGHLILIEATNFSKVVQSLNDFVQAS